MHTFLRNGTTAKEDQREQMRKAVQLQAAREKEMRQRVMQKMNEKQQAKRAAAQSSDTKSDPGSVPSEVQSLSAQLDNIESALEHASDTQILKGRGALSVPITVPGLLTKDDAFHHRR